MCRDNCNFKYSDIGGNRCSLFNKPCDDFIPNINLKVENEKEPGGQELARIIAEDMLSFPNPPIEELHKAIVSEFDYIRSLNNTDEAIGQLNEMKKQEITEKEDLPKCSDEGWLSTRDEALKQLDKFKRVLKPEVKKDGRSCVNCGHLNTTFMEDGRKMGRCLPPRHALSQYCVLDDPGCVEYKERENKEYGSTDTKIMRFAEEIEKGVWIDASVYHEDIEKHTELLLTIDSDGDFDGGWGGCDFTEKRYWDGTVIEYGITYYMILPDIPE